jgi:hypothetical protein
LLDARFAGIDLGAPLFPTRWLTKGIKELLGIPFGAGLIVCGLGCEGPLVTIVSKYQRDGLPVEVARSCFVGGHLGVKLLLVRDEMNMGLLLIVHV